MINVKEEMDKLYQEKVLNRYDSNNITVEDARKVMAEDEYICLLCHKLEYWLNESKIYKVCEYYKAIIDYITEEAVDCDRLPDAFQVIITAAKYYVKAVYTVKDVYNL